MKRMSIVSVGMALLAVVSNASHAAVVAFEGFDAAGTEDVTNGIYKAACSMHLQTLVKGGNIVGMGSYDWALSTATGAFTTQAGSLNSLISGAGSSGRLDVNLVAAGSFVSRALTRQLDAAPTQPVLYISGLLSAAALETESTGIGGMMGFTDGNAGSFWSPGSFDGLMFGFRGDGNSADLVLWGGGAARTILQDVSSNTTYHVVAQVIFNAAGNETINVWVNPASGSPETPDYRTSAGDFADALSDFSYASVYTRAKSAITTSLDELTLATAYSDLVPDEEIIIVDENEAILTGSWSSQSNAVAYDGDYRLALAGGGGSCEWPLSLVNYGYYKVYVRWDADSNRTTTATYSIQHAHGINYRTVNQTVEGGVWKYLGAFQFDGYSDEGITLHQSVGGNVSADAIKLESFPQDRNYELVIDNGDNAFCQSAGWSAGTGGSFYNGSNYLYGTYGADKWAQWDIDVSGSLYGDFKIYASFRPHGNRTAAAEYTITDLNGEQAPVLLDQREVSDDIYRYDYTWLGSWGDYNHTNSILNDPYTVASTYWHYIGNAHLLWSGGRKVVLTPGATGFTVPDAIKIVQYNGGPPAGTGTWDLVFNDEFNGDSLDMNVWDSSDGSAGVTYDVSRHPGNNEVGDGLLRQVAHKLESPNEYGKNWTAASIWTKEKPIKYGYLECRMRLADCVGYNQAFWAVAYDTRDNKVTSDTSIAECLYPNLVRMAVNHHKSNVHSENKGHYLRLYTNEDLSETFHIFGVWFKPDETLFYIDGNLVKANQNEGRNEEYLSDDANVEGVTINFSTMPHTWDGISEIPASLDGKFMEVDWVRAYKQR